MEEQSGPPGVERQADRWEEFYQEHKRPWRGIGKISLDIPPGSKVLDMGCGTGKTTAALVKMGMEVTGLDFSPTAISRCIGDFGDRARFVLAECSRMPFPDGHFDAVVAVHVLEHLDDTELAGAVREVRRVLAPGGLALVRAFAVGDMRAEGGDRGTRGNGIEYRYYTEEGMRDVFKGFELVSCERRDETMRFGAVRVKVECLFRLPEDGKCL
ncbi:MAG: methyltransferase domain-containing protein [Methanomassiliicoccaceae archaeon]|nr:methyltransferase domain-containing protein [Methanomassiliicoccaceae archaeon]